jgi:hypothetical protein
MDDSIFTYAGGAVMAALGFHLKRAQSQTDANVDAALKKGADNALELEKYKTHVSEIYAKDATMQQSLARLHERIDDIGIDIKTLIREAKK